MAVYLSFIHRVIRGWEKNDEMVKLGRKNKDRDVNKPTLCTAFPSRFLPLP